MIAVILPVCERDESAAIRNLEWLVKLDDSTSHPCLISCEHGFDESKVFKAASRYFNTLRVHKYPTLQKTLGWPDAPNKAWRTVATNLYRYYRNIPWLWWEQDAIPLKRDWLNLLDREYHAYRKPFMGTMGAKPRPQDPDHLNGVAVYPPNVGYYVPSAMFYGSHIPFDTAGGLRVLKQSKITPLMQHVWSFDGPSGKAPTFPDDESLKRISDEAVLFHRCKDGSIIDRLSKPEVDEEIPEITTTKAPFVILGRYGDITNLLPVFESEALNGPVDVVTSREFSGLFDGVSYVEPHFLDLPGDQLSNAISLATEQFKTVRPVQVWGDGTHQSFATKHYNQDAWRMAGNYGFNDKSMLPVFDARSPKREDELAKQYIKGDRPVILLAIQGGYSSPFKKYRELETPLRHGFGDYQLIDLCEIKAHRVYDLIGLMDRATALITADSVHLHLAAASKVPTAALLSNRSPWAQTEPRCNVYYSEVTDAAIKNVRKLLSATKKLPKLVYKDSQRFIHAVEPFWKERLSEERFLLSWKSWFQLYRTHELLAGWVGFKPTRHSIDIGDTRELTYMKELLSHAADLGRDDDVVVWTNGDNVLATSVIEKLRVAISKTPVVTSRRVDYHTQKPHPGRDLAAFKISWLREHWDTIPDFILGAPEFDVWMALQARHVIGSRPTAKQLMNDLPPAELEPGQVMHVHHGVSPWDGINRKKVPSNAYNLRLLREWCEANNSAVTFNPDGTVDWSR